MKNHDQRIRLGICTVLALLLGMAAVVVPTPALAVERTMRVDTISAPGGTKAAELGNAGRALFSQVEIAPFAMVGASWAGTGDGEARVRVHTSEGWGPWTDLEAEEEDAPDLGSPEDRNPRAVTRAMWVDEADGFQMEAPGNQLQVHLVREDDSGVRLRPERGARALDRPPIGDRAAWGARPPKDTPGVASGLKMAFVHHTAGSNSYGPGDVPRILRGDQAYHMDVQGWDDLGYNFVVDRFGRVWEGRAGGVHRPVIGAHTQGFNTASTGVAVIGTFSTTDVPSAAVDGLSQLLGWKLELHGVNPEGSAVMTSAGNDRYPDGTNVRFPAISGHRDGKATDCPGQRLYDRLPRIRALARSDAFMNPLGDGINNVFRPYGPFRGGASVSEGDLEGNGSEDVVTGAGPGGGPHVRDFGTDGSPRPTGFFAYSPAFAGGVDVALGDVVAESPGDEIITGAGPGGGPHVLVYGRDGTALRSFFAYSPAFRGGVRVSAGDVVPESPGDEIITGAGPGGGPHVLTYRADGLALNGFFAYSPAFRGGVDVGAGDVVPETPGAEIITGAGPGGGPHVLVHRGDGVALRGFFAYPLAFRGGVTVAAGDVVPSSPASEIVTGAGPGGGPQVLVFRGDSALLTGTFAFNVRFTGGVDVSAGPSTVMASTTRYDSVVRRLPL